MKGNLLLFRTATRYILPLVLVFSVFLLIRGHNAPGGGFVGGLVAATAYTLLTLAFGVDVARAALPTGPRTFIALGLLIALASGLVAPVASLPLLTGLWLPFEVPVIGKVGTPLIFDGGVYLLVMGITLTMVFALAEAQ